MRVVLEEHSWLKDMVNTISELVNECQIKLDADGMKIVAMDPANVAMVNLLVLRTAFTEYEVDNEELVGISVESLKQVMRRSGADDVLTLRTDDNKFKVSFKGKTSKSFSLPIIDIDAKQQKVPEFQYPLRVVMPSGLMSDTVEDAGIVAESMQLITEPERFIVIAEGDLNAAKIEIPQEKPVQEGEEKKDGAKISLDAQQGEKVVARFAYEYMKKIMTGSKLSDEVSVRYSADKPLTVEFKKPDKYSMSFILAPRVENV